MPLLISIVSQNGIFLPMRNSAIKETRLLSDALGNIAANMPPTRPVAKSTETYSSSGNEHHFHQPRSGTSMRGYATPDPPITRQSSGKNVIFSIRIDFLPSSYIESWQQGD